MAGFSDADPFLLSLVKSLVVRLGLIDVYGGFEVASGYLLNCDASLECAQFQMDVGFYAW
jgi:hypothetical protein